MHDIYTPIPDDRRPLCRAYFHAKRVICDNGFAGEIDSYRQKAYRTPSIQDFLKESAWVVLGSGFRERTLASVFPSVSRAFLNWRSATRIIENREGCVQRASRVFNHRPKLEAIVTIAESVAREDIACLYRTFGNDLSELQRYPYIGPVTQYHLAKNIGLPVAKPDRHLKRICSLFSCSSVQQLCRDIQAAVGDPIPVVDTVLWRYATLTEDYMQSLMSVSQRA